MEHDTRPTMEHDIRPTLEHDTRPTRADNGARHQADTGRQWSTTPGRHGPTMEHDTRPTWADNGARHQADKGARNQAENGAPGWQWSLLQWSWHEASNGQHAGPTSEQDTRLWRRHTSGLHWTMKPGQHPMEVSNVAWQNHLTIAQKSLRLCTLNLAKCIAL